MAKCEDPKHEDFRPMSEHAAVLADALRGIGEMNLEVDDAASYLRLAAGVRSVEFDTSSFDPTFGLGLCEGAEVYQENLDRLWALLAHRVAVFLFAWAALENYKKRLPLHLVPKDKLRRKGRKIARLCYFLSEQYSEPLPAGYEHLLDIFKRVAKRAEVARGATVTTKVPDFVRAPAEGLYLVYEFRNAFAHGDFATPEPDERDPRSHPDIVVVALASRIVLLTLQMMTLCHYPKDQVCDIQALSIFEREDEERLTVREAFLNLHRASFTGRLRASQKT